MTFLLAMACDAPQRTRYPTADVFGGFGTGDGANVAGDPAADPTNPTTPQTPTNAEPGFDYCNLAYQYHGGAIGNFGICQNSYDKRKFMAKFETPDNLDPTQKDGTCFVPMHKQGAASFMLGNPECVHKQSNVEYNIPLYTNRPETVNAVMMVKEVALNAFLGCMTAKADYMNMYPGCNMNQSCMSAADAYANSVCNTFKNTHSNNYKQVEFF